MSYVLLIGKNPYHETIKVDQFTRFMLDLCLMIPIIHRKSEIYLTGEIVMKQP